MIEKGASDWKQGMSYTVYNDHFSRRRWQLDAEDIEVLVKLGLTDFGIYRIDAELSKIQILSRSIMLREVMIPVLADIVSRY